MYPSTIGLYTQHTNKQCRYWSTVVDKGFIGLQDYVPVYKPHRCLPRRRLALRQEQWNRARAGVRIVCENWYGRHKSLWRCMSTKFRGDREKHYELYFGFCAALTNFNCLLHPLVRRLQMH